MEKPFFEKYAKKIQLSLLILLLIIILSELQLIKHLLGIYQEVHLLDSFLQLFVESFFTLFLLVFGILLFFRKRVGYGGISIIALVLWLESASIFLRWSGGNPWSFLQETFLFLPIAFLSYRMARIVPRQREKFIMAKNLFLALIIGTFFAIFLQFGSIHKGVYDLFPLTAWTKSLYLGSFLFQWLLLIPALLTIVATGTKLDHSSYDRRLLFLLIPFSLLLENIIFPLLANTSLGIHYFDSEFGGMKKFVTGFFFSVIFLLFSTVYALVLFFKKKKAVI